MTTDKSSLNLLLHRMRHENTKLVPIGSTIVGKLVSYPTLQKWVKLAGFPAVQIGSRWYSDNESLVDWICKHCPKLAGFVTETCITDDTVPVADPIVEPDEPQQEMEDDDLL